MNKEQAGVIAEVAGWIRDGRQVESNSGESWQPVDSSTLGLYGHWKYRLKPETHAVSRNREIIHVREVL